MWYNIQILINNMTVLFSLLENQPNSEKKKIDSQHNQIQTFSLQNEKFGKLQKLHLTFLVNGHSQKDFVHLCLFHTNITEGAT